MLRHMPDEPISVHGQMCVMREDIRGIQIITIFFFCIILV